MHIQDLKIVLKVAELRSITAAATHFDMRLATASAAVKRVEQTLGVELFIRTTRSLRLSSAGERYIPQCEQALAMLTRAGQSLKDDPCDIDGELRIAVSSDLGRNLLTPWLHEFTATHPNIGVRTHIGDSMVDFYRDAVDMALRYGKPNDASLYGFKVCDIPRLLCASPDYLATHGTPKHPQELTTHQGLFYQRNDIIHDQWEFTDPNDNSTIHKIKMHGNIASNDGDIVRRWCVAGYGLALKSGLEMADDLAAGRVVSLLRDYAPIDNELWLVFPSRQLITPAARLLREMLKAKCAQTLQGLIQLGVIRSH